MSSYPSRAAGSQDHCAFDLGRIFIGREQQLDLFQLYLSRWQEHIAGVPSDNEAPAMIAPSPDNKIQGLVVLIYGRGGIGKSTLLRRFREKVLQASDLPRASKVTASRVIDWESASEGRRGLFAAAPGKEIDAAGYFRLLCTQLASALGKSPDDFKHYQRAGRDVEEARKDAERVIESLRSDERYAGLRWAAGEGLIGLLRLVPYVGAPLRDEQIAGKAKELLGEGAAMSAEQLVRLHARLNDKLGAKFGDYLEPDLKLGLNLGYDLRDLARNYPLLIFFDTYETIDEGDCLLRMVMSAADRRVGWIIAGRDNLWAGVEQRLRSLGIEYGYREIVLPDRGLDIDFSKSNTGAFTRTDIKEYFDELCSRVPSDPPLLQINEEQAADIEAVTRGIPLAVRIAAAIYMETRDISAITKQEQGRRDIVDQMVRRYLLHVRDDENDRPRLYGLALLPRANQPHAVAVALQLSSEEVETRYGEELARLQRRYSFIFTEAEQPALHGEVRYFLLLWLLEHRAQPDITSINERLKAAQAQSLQQLEEHRHYSALKDRLQDDEWIGIYLDLAEQQYWLDPVEGLRLLLPFMLAAAIYHPAAYVQAVLIGNFFAGLLGSPYRSWWAWSSGSSIYTGTSIIPEGGPHGLEELHKLMQQRPIFAQPLSAYRNELEAVLWWWLGEAYSGFDDRKALEWYEKALTRLGEERELKEATAWVCWNIVYKLEKKRAEWIPLLDRAIELKPDYAAAYNGRGVAYRELKQYERAVSDYDQAIRLDPKYATAYNNRGNAYADQQQYEQAIADYNKAIELDPKFAYAYICRGGAYIMQQQYEQAIADHNKAIELDPNDATAYTSRGTAYHSQQRYEQAIADYDQAIRLDPKYAYAYANRGKAYADQQQYEQAIADYNRAIELDPNLAVASNRGLAHYFLKQYEQAMADCNKAIELDPNYAYAYTNRGRVYFYLKQYEQAMADYNKAIELDPKLANAYTNRGNAYANQQQYEQAMADYNKAIELDPKLANAYTNRGLAHYFLKQYEQAMADCNKAIELDPNYAYAYTNRGRVYFYLKQYEQAMADYNKAIELDPSDALAYSNRGAAHRQLKQYEQAMADYNKAIELDPNLVHAYDMRGVIHLLLKRSIQAVTDYKRCYELDQKSINAAWMAEWASMVKQRPGVEMARRLEEIARIDPEHYIAYVCRGVALGLRNRLKEGLEEMKQAAAIAMIVWEQWDPYFWKGMLCAYHYWGQSHDRETMEAIEKALEVNMPPVLLLPLYWLETDRPDFFARCAKPLLERYGV